MFDVGVTVGIKWSYKALCGWIIKSAGLYCGTAECFTLKMRSFYHLCWQSLHPFRNTAFSLPAHAVLNIIHASFVMPTANKRSSTSLLSCWVSAAAERLTLVAKSFSSSRQLSEISAVERHERWRRARRRNRRENIEKGKKNSYIYLRIMFWRI